MEAEAASEILLADQGLRDQDADSVSQRILDEQQTLTSLDLRGNELTDASCDALAASIVVVPSLRLVDLSDNAITNAGRLTIFRALANARRRCNVLLSGEGVRDILLAVKPPSSVFSGSPSRPSDAPATPERHDSPPPVASQIQRSGASETTRLSPPRIARANSPSALAEQAIADAERAMARSQIPRGSPFVDRVPAKEATRDHINTSHRNSVDATTHTGRDPTPAVHASPSVSAAPDEVRLENRALTSVPTRLGEDRPGRVRPRKIDLSNNTITSLSGLPQSVVQLKAANNSLRDWEGISVLPRLQRLDLSYNQLRQMGPFGICCAIRVLRLKGNAISSLAGIEGAARTLIELDVSDNVLRSVDDIQPLTGCTRLTSVKLDGNPLLEDVAHTVKSRAYRSILARLPNGCTLADDTSSPSGPLFTPSRPSNRDKTVPGSSSSSYSERRRRQATPSSTTAKTMAATSGGSWPRRAESVGSVRQMASFDMDGSTVAVDLSAPSSIRADDAHTLSTLMPPDDDTEPYMPAIRADSLHPRSHSAADSAARATIFSTGGSDARPTSPLQQRTRRHWSPSGRRNNTNDAKVKAVARKSRTNKHLSFRGKEQRRAAAASDMGRHNQSAAATSASNLMTPTKSIGSKYSRSSPHRSGSRQRDRADANNGNPLGRLAGHPGWPVSPPESTPQRLEANQKHCADDGTRSDAPRSARVPSPSGGHQPESMPRRAASVPRKRLPRRSASPSRVHGSPSTSFSAHGSSSSAVEAHGKIKDENETVQDLNAKITKLYNWHLAEMDLVQKQQMQLNQVTAELQETKSALSSQEQLLRLQLAADANGVPIDGISMANVDLETSLGSTNTSNSADAVSNSLPVLRPGENTAPAAANAGAVAAAALEAAVATVRAPPLQSSAGPLNSIGTVDGLARRSAETTSQQPSDTGGASSSVLPPTPTLGQVGLAGVPLSTPIILHDLQEELSGTVDELTATRKALGHALTIMQSAGIADGKLKPLRQMLHQSGVTSPGPCSPSVDIASSDRGV